MKELEDLVEDGINEIFGKAQRANGVDGDISPELVIELDKVQAQLVSVLKRQLMEATKTVTP